MSSPRRARKRAEPRASDDLERITRALDRALRALVEQRLDALARRYEAAWTEARARLARGFEDTQRREAIAGRPPLPKVRLTRVGHAWRTELELAFLKGAEAEIEAAAVLRGTIVEALDRVEERIAAAEREGAARITAAFLRFQAEAWLTTQIEEARVTRRLATLGPARPRTRAEQQRSLRASEEAVARVKDDELAFAAQVTAARAGAAEWQLRAALALAHGGDDLAAEAQARVDAGTRLADEVERTLTEHRVARETFERRLEKIRANMPTDGTLDRATKS